ncbi:hypothetical protein T265_04118, partial [Opisthorchis viverrini]
CTLTMLFMRFGVMRICWALQNGTRTIEFHPGNTTLYGTRSLNVRNHQKSVWRIRSRQNRS